MDNYIWEFWSPHVHKNQTKIVKLQNVFTYLITEKRELSLYTLLV